MFEQQRVLANNVGNQQNYFQLTVKDPVRTKIRLITKVQVLSFLHSS